MKKVSIGVVLIVGIFALVNCKTTKETVNPEINSSANVVVDSLELARKNKVDSISQIKRPSNTKPKSVVKPKKGSKKQL
jgi:hypothetical protein|tara:strand:- start:200 stop:436 length:237 start_codon:yes stop_codon:yes gene_type:complete